MRKEMFKVLTGAVSIAVLLSACGSKGSESASTASPAAGAAATTKVEQLAPVELIWNYPLSAIPQDMASVQEAVNKITKAKINATVKLQPQTFADYVQKMNTTTASGENYDIAWVSNWNWDYVTNQSKGAFIPLDDLMAKYAPTLDKSMPQFVWDATKINGKVYGIPNYQTVTNKQGFLIQKKYADKYNLDVNSIKKIEDLEPFLAKVKAGESKDVVPFLMDRTGRFGNMYRGYGLEAIVANAGIGVDLKNPDKVINMFETPQYAQYLDVAKSWHDKGYINENAATLKNKADIEKTGNAVVQVHNVLKPGVETQFKTANGGNDVIAIPTTEVWAGTGSIITTMQAISKTSKNPERAMMFINLLNTDKELYNTISFGVEGKHYTKNADNTIKINKEAGYVPNASWVFGNTFNGLLVEGTDPNVVANTQKENETAKASPLMGFKFVNSAVIAEIANIATVIDQYRPALETGTVAASDKLKEFQDKLKAAGIDKVVAEAQKQLDEWKKTK
ncbi:ABC transporter substrate-binding protein [Paenibacillus aceris]|uniref:Aldouronate transport system substrate-binding protein n=1 Tax=Paenibacillus aceris TaxID=869555 RepID=A0ABS4I1U5_9BACL|nr:ABC transporter substrate-binding protein [Paenibacillus aceris]MBP1964887.1 putative aldouronate transport system substrate-binding protein [Paenibacillus aceris]NHW38132.1 ABC transporter substrate-binding protein [Paenibacillus aceris]